MLAQLYEFLISEWKIAIRRWIRLSWFSLVIIPYLLGTILCGIIVGFFSLVYWVRDEPTENEVWIFPFMTPLIDLLKWAFW